MLLQFQINIYLQPLNINNNMAYLRLDAGQLACRVYLRLGGRLQLVCLFYTSKYRLSTVACRLYLWLGGCLQLVCRFYTSKCGLPMAGCRSAIMLVLSTAGVPVLYPQICPIYGWMPVLSTAGSSLMAGMPVLYPKT